MNEERNTDQLSMWNRWSTDKKQEDLDNLLTSLNPLVASEVNRYSTYPIPRNVLNTHASLLARDAIEKYDPSKGTALGTHVANGLQPLSRFVQRYSNAKYVPERVSQEYGRFEKGQSELSESLGRQPTVPELAKHLGRSEEYINRIELAKAPEANTSYFEEDREDFAGAELWRRAQDDKLSYLRAELPEGERKAFDLLRGRGYNPAIGDKGEVAKKLGIPVEDVYSMTRRWTRRLSE